MVDQVWQQNEKDHQRDRWKTIYGDCVVKEKLLKIGMWTLVVLAVLMCAFSSLVYLSYRDSYKHYNGLGSGIKFSHFEFHRKGSSSSFYFCICYECGDFIYAWSIFPFRNVEVNLNDKYWK